MNFILINLLRFRKAITRVSSTRVLCNVIFGCSIFFIGPITLLYCSRFSYLVGSMISGTFLVTSHYQCKISWFVIWIINYPAKLYNVNLVAVASAAGCSRIKRIAWLQNKRFDLIAHVYRPTTLSCSRCEFSHWKVDDVVNLEVDKIGGVCVGPETENGSNGGRDQMRKSMQAVNNVYLEWIRWSAGATSSDRDKNADKICIRRRRLKLNLGRLCFQRPWLTRVTAAATRTNATIRRSITSSSNEGASVHWRVDTCRWETSQIRVSGRCALVVCSRIICRSFHPVNRSSIHVTSNSRL